MRSGCCHTALRISLYLLLNMSKENWIWHKPGSLYFPGSFTPRCNHRQNLNLPDFLLYFSESLQKLLILAYEPLDTPAGRDLCYSCMEFPFFKPLWPMLLAVLRWDKLVTISEYVCSSTTSRLVGDVRGKNQRRLGRELFKLSSFSVWSLPQTNWEPVNRLAVTKFVLCCCVC